MGKNLYKIIIVDDSQNFIDAIKILLRSHSDLEIIGEANNAIQIQELLKTKKPDIILMDINLPKINGLIAGKRALMQNPNSTIIGVTMNDEYNIHYDMQRIGFKAGILKNNFSKDFNIALQNIEQGEVYFPVLIKK